MTAIGMGLDAYAAVDASATLSGIKLQAGLLRMLWAGVVLSRDTTLMAELFKDNAPPDAAAVYDAMDMPRAKLVSQVAQACAK